MACMESFATQFHGIATAMDASPFWSRESDSEKNSLGALWQDKSSPRGVSPPPSEPPTPFLLRRLQVKRDAGSSTASGTSGSSTPASLCSSASQRRRRANLKSKSESTSETSSPVSGLAFDSDSGEAETPASPNDVSFHLRPHSHKNSLVCEPELVDVPGPNPFLRSLSGSPAADEEGLKPDLIFVSELREETPSPFSRHMLPTSTAVSLSRLLQILYPVVPPSLHHDHPTYHEDEKFAARALGGASCAEHTNKPARRAHRPAGARRHKRAYHTQTDAEPLFGTLATPALHSNPYIQEFTDLNIPDHELDPFLLTPTMPGSFHSYHFPPWDSNPNPPSASYDESAPQWEDLHHLFGPLPPRAESWKALSTEDYSDPDARGPEDMRPTSWEVEGEEIRRERHVLCPSMRV